MGTHKPEHDVRDLWNRALPALRQIVGDKAYRTCIVMIEAMAADDASVTLYCPTASVRKEAETRHAGAVAEVLERLSGRRRKVIFTCGPDVKLAAQRPPDLWEGDAALREPLLIQGSRPLERHLTFGNFVTARENAAARDAMHACATQREGALEPVFVFGPSGSGKSHLLSAVAWRVLEHDPRRRALHLTAEELLERCLLPPDERGAFFAAMAEADIVLVDEMERLAGKTETVEAQAVFALIEATVARGARVILSADVPPTRLDFLPKALKTRLAQGWLVETPAAGLDLRLAILCAAMRRRSHEIRGFELDISVLRTIAGQLHGDARVLLGALRRIEMRWRSEPCQVTAAIANTWLSDFFKAHKRMVSVAEIKRAVAAYYRLRVADLETQNRQREFVKPRQVSMYLARTLTTRSFPEIARGMARDHTTIMHGYNRIRLKLATDKDLAAEIEAIKNSIRHWPGDPPGTSR